MPALNRYAFETLVHLAHGAREAFLSAHIRPEADVDRVAGVLRNERSTGRRADRPQPLSFSEAMQSTAQNPENLAHWTDACLTALSGFHGEAFNGAFRIAKQSLGRDDMVDGLLLHAALGTRPDPKSKAYFNEASYR